MPKTSRANRASQTDLIQPNQQGGFRATLPAVHRASTVLLESVEKLRRTGWDADPSPYGREGTPTTRELERRLARLEGAGETILVPSGLAAIYVTCVALLKAGDEVAMPANFYGSAVQMAETLLARFGIGLRRYEPGEASSLAAALGPRTRLVWIEAVGSVSLEVPDLGALIAAAKAANVTVAIDNTYAAGLHLQAFALGADVSVQALTKLQSGGSDVVLGSVSAANAALICQLKLTRHYLGLNVSSDDAYLVLRGLPTLRMRYSHSRSAAEQIAPWFDGKPGVRRVHFPPLASSPGHAHWKRYFTSAPGLISVAMGTCPAEHIVEGLDLFHIGYSWGGPLSLVMLFEESHPAVIRLRAVDPEIRQVVRFWIGLEEPTDLMEDIAQAWASVD
ncbi:PLP-dependent transferase [Ramlibacter tataouinensis]|uniref:Candidate cystathionine beta-lyase (CBL) n=1 Tax=Ramlibacter tataouinensis (strain ATCC BAA-407 / DSM 14655 / LMG 21543 / TTB310) TaxID=365046 RepID=F5XXB1_RAMTT|nr:PLP-dependent transferase [Ramlibacter tataouinensis]AEG94246.1 candidate cystathionine beta-lyase (CBL) [Ramlibacter tataouinensis TTB310]